MGLQPYERKHGLSINLIKPKRKIMQRSKINSLKQLWGVLVIVCLISPQLAAQANLVLQKTIGNSTSGNANGQFNEQQGVFIASDGSIFVADLNNNRVQKFDKNGAFVSTFGSTGTGDGQLTGPSGIAIDSKGNIFVVDRFNNRVQKFNSSGTHLKTIGTTATSNTNGDFNNPTSIVVDKSDNIYVVDRSNDRVQKFSNDGTFVKVIGSQGAADGQFNLPFGIAIDANDNIYVTDGTNDNVQKFNSDGVFQSKFGTNGTGDGQFELPAGIAVDAKGNIYVSDGIRDNIQVFNSAGTFVKKFTTPNATNNKAEFFLALDANGVLYISDAPNHHIRVYAPEQEINVKQGTTNIASGNTVDFGSVTVGQSKDFTFTIENLGGVDLKLNGAAGSLIAGGGTHASEFTITQNNVTSPISGFSSKMFSVKFTAGAVGDKTATLTISSNDTNEGTYTINLTGKSTAPLVPEINLKLNNKNIASGGSLDFGNIVVGKSSADSTFTIENLGTAALTITGTAGSLVAISGTNAADFTVTQTNVASPIAAGNKVTFTVKFTAGALGAATAMLTITNNDADEGTTTVNLKGNGLSNVTGLPRNLSNGDLSVGPIPTSNRINISITGQVSHKVGYQLVGLQGQSTLQGTTEIKNGQLSLDLSKVARGHYLLILQMANERLVRRISKQ